MLVAANVLLKCRSDVCWRGAAAVASQNYSNPPVGAHGKRASAVIDDDGSHGRSDHPPSYHHSQEYEAAALQQQGEQQDPEVRWPPAVAWQRGTVQAVVTTSHPPHLLGLAAPASLSCCPNHLPTCLLQDAETVHEVARGLRSYFDRGLRQFLLTSHELAQADEALGGGGSLTPPLKPGEQVLPAGWFRVGYCCVSPALLRMFVAGRNGMSMAAWQATGACCLLNVAAPPLFLYRERWKRQRSRRRRHRPLRGPQRPVWRRAPGPPVCEAA